MRKAMFVLLMVFGTVAAASDKPVNLETREAPFCWDVRANACGIYD